MTPAQRRKEIQLMINWLKKKGLIDYTMKASNPRRYQVHLINGYRHHGDTPSTHAYLSGAVAVAYIYEYKEFVK